MNKWLQAYTVDVRFPEVSGIEHLQMLQLRDRLAEIELHFSGEEREQLKAADQQLIGQATAFHAALAQFVDLVSYRHEHSINPAHWWWYLDVLSQAPIEVVPPATTLSVA